MADPPSDGSDALQVLLSACKLLDLLLVLQTEEFQMCVITLNYSFSILTCSFSHQWIFVTDTVDAIYRPDAWSPEALLDQLAEIVGNLATSESSVRIETSRVTSKLTRLLASVTCKNFR